MQFSWPGRLLCAFIPLVALTACKGPHSINLQPTVEEPLLASAVRVADPKASRQLLAGFHNVEHGSWRWTKSHFEVALAPPAEAARDGAFLVLKFAIPDPLIARFRSITLSASAGNTALEPETYTTPGDHEYRRHIAASALNPESETLRFRLDKFFPAGAVEARELGIVAFSAALEVQ